MTSSKSVKTVVKKQLSKISQISSKKTQVKGEAEADVVVSFTNVDSSDSFKLKAENLLKSAVSKFFKKNTWFATITVSKKNKRDISVVIEAFKTDTKAPLFKSSGSSYYPDVALNNALGKLQSQLRKHHSVISKYTKSQMNHTLGKKYEINIEHADISFDADHVDLSPEAPQIISSQKPKDYHMMDLSIEEAVMKLDLLDSNSLAFIEKESGIVCFISKNNDSIELIKAVQSDTYTKNQVEVISSDNS